MSAPALDVALAYYEAWTSKDFDRAMTYIADDIVCDAPPGLIEGADRVSRVHGPVPVKHAPGAECVTVVDGKIVRSQFVFDRLPFQPKT